MRDKDETSTPAVEELLRKNDRLLQSLESTFNLLQQQQQQISSSSLGETVTRLRVELARLTTLWEPFEKINIGLLAEDVRKLLKNQEESKAKKDDRKTQILILFIGQILTVGGVILLALLKIPH